MSRSWPSKSAAISTAISASLAWICASVNSTLTRSFSTWADSMAAA